MFFIHYLKSLIVLLEIMDAFSLDMNLTLRTNTNTISFRYSMHENVHVKNPVLKDYSELLQWIRRDTKLKRTRNKRQTSSWDCNGLCKRSLCPWTETLHNDTMRVPASVPKAVCNNSKCNFNFTGSNVPIPFNLLSTCEPLTTDVFAVVNNKETFLKDWPIACICTRRSVARVPRVKQKGMYRNRSGQFKSLVSFPQGRRQRQMPAKHKHRHFHENRFYKMPFLFLPQFK